MQSLDGFGPWFQHSMQAHPALERAFQQTASFAAENKALTATLAAGTVIAGAVTVHRLLNSKSKGRKPTCFQLGGGSISRADVSSTFADYEKAYSKSGSTEQKVMADTSRTAELVDTFYNLVTDIYEWGWGQSFHFSPKLPGKTVAASEAAHEARVAALLNLGPGKQCLDAGCGVGGPMRTIASVSGANVVGITINDYQVQRAQHHNKQLGLTTLCDVVEGNFLELPFQANSFDAAYAIEATCHAPKLEDVYSQIHRVLRPGARFVTYEWVTTKLFDPTNADHVAIIDQINYGNGLPDMRTYKEAEEAGKKVGFKLVSSVDLATASAPCEMWYSRLTSGRWLYRGVNAGLVNLLGALRIAPRGLVEVHNMLLDTVDALLEGGKTGIFTPMHMLVFEKL